MISDSKMYVSFICITLMLSLPCINIWNTVNTNIVLATVDCFTNMRMPSAAVSEVKIHLLHSIPKICDSKIVFIEGQLSIQQCKKSRLLNSTP